MTREQIAILNHLSHNLYPPVPFMQASAVQAIAYRRTGVTPEGYPKGHVHCPPALVDGRTNMCMPADEVIKNCRLEDFLAQDA